MPSKPRPSKALSQAADNLMDAMQQEAMRSTEKAQKLLEVLSAKTSSDTPTRLPKKARNDS